MGVTGKTGEFIVGDSRGVWKTRTVQRRPLEDRWSSLSVEMVVGVPWDVKNDGEKADGDKPEVIVMPREEDKETRNALPEEAVPRRLKIRKADLYKHGFTAKCLGVHGGVAGRGGEAAQRGVQSPN